MRKIKLSIGILAIAFVTLTIISCKDAKHKHDHSGGNHTEMSSDEKHMEMNNESDEHNQNDEGHGHDNSNGTRDVMSSTHKNALTGHIIDAYIQIKNGLVTDNRDDAAKGGTALLAAFSNFDMSQLDDAQHKEYMEIAESGIEQAEHIVKNPIDHQREHFETLSTDIFDLVTLLGTDKTLYQDYCPMKKTTWLSEVKEIKNPFYGSEMLTCGNIKEQIN